MSRVLPDPTRLKRIQLGRGRLLIFERTVYGPNSKTLAINLKGRRRVLTVMLRSFQLNGIDNCRQCQRGRHYRCTRNWDGVCCCKETPLA